MTSPRDVYMPTMTIVGIRSVVSFDELQQFFGTSFERVADEMARVGMQATGAPTSVYFGSGANGVDVLAGFPVSRAPASTSASTLNTTTIPAGRAATIVHRGSFENVGVTYSELHDWMTSQKLGEPGLMIEQYLVGPASGTNPSEWMTQVTYYVSVHAPASVESPDAEGSVHLLEARMPAARSSTP